MKPTFILLAISLLLAACATAAPEPTAVPPTSTPLPTATPTVIPTPTLLFMDMELQGIFTDAGLNPNSLDLNNAHWDPNVGLTIYSSDGTEIVIPEEDLMNRVKVGQEGNLQMLTEDGTAVMYAVDSATNEVIFAEDWMKWPIVSVEACINVDSYEAMEKVWEKESLFTLPFDPNRTYFPNKEDIFRDWSNRASYTQSSDPNFNYYFPLGILPEGMEPPMRFINCVVVDTGVGYPMMVVSQQVFNPADGSSSIMRFVIGGGGDLISQVSPMVHMQKTGDNRYFLPTWDFSDLANTPTIGGYKRYLQSKGINVNNGKISNFKGLIDQWLVDGKVPPKLEEIIMHAAEGYWEHE